MRSPQVLDQLRPCALVLHQYQVDSLPVLVLSVHHVVLLRNLWAQVRVLQVVLPTVNQHHGHRAIQWFEHTPRSRGGWIVVRLLARRAVIALEDVLELGEGLAVGPELDHLALDDP